MHKYNPPIFYKGRGIKFSKPKDTKTTYQFGVPKEFPDIVKKLTSLYKFYLYDVSMGEKKMDELFSSEEISALKRFVENPTVDNLGKLPVSYRNYITKYDNYIKIIQDLQEQRDLERWRKMFK